ncbi:MAG: zinc-ribbon domain-containing protein [Desulfatiglandales bacterium]
MEVICEHCNAKLNIPDAKIPKDQRVKIGCPKCKKKITLDYRDRPELISSSGSGSHYDTGKFYLKFLESKSGSASEEEGYTYKDYSEDEALHYFEEDTKLALVMDSSPGHSGRMKSAVEELGYKCISTPDTRDAIGKMRFHHFDLVILSDGFDGQPTERSPILNYLNNISMSVRRRIFVALIGDKFKTMDNMMAFATSANVVIHSKDMQRLSPILKKAISDHEKFYKVFMDGMLETGKV